jgi:hypothetical protein
MRAKRIIMICIVIGLLATLATTVYAAPGFHPSTPNLVGTWRMTVSLAEGTPETFEALHTFFADGNWVEVNEFKESNHGVWIGSGNTYLLTFEGYTFDEQGQHNGKSQVRASIKMDGAEHLTAEWVLNAIDLEGKVTEKAAFGTFEGTRMEVELP